MAPHTPSLSGVAKRVVPPRSPGRNRGKTARQAAPSETSLTGGRGVAVFDRAPVILPPAANLLFGCAGVVGWRDEGQGSLDLDHDDVLDGTGYTTLSKEREDFIEERAVPEDTGDALEPVPLAEKGIDDVDLDRGIVAKVGDGAGRADIGEDEMFVIPYGGRALGGKVRRSVRADGRNEAKSLTLDPGASSRS